MTYEGVFLEASDFNIGCVILSKRVTRVDEIYLQQFTYCRSILYVYARLALAHLLKMTYRLIILKSSDTFEHPSYAHKRVRGF